MTITKTMPQTAKLKGINKNTIETKDKKEQRIETPIRHRTGKTIEGKGGNNTNKNRRGLRTF